MHGIFYLWMYMLAMRKLYETILDAQGRLNTLKVRQRSSSYLRLQMLEL